MKITHSFLALALTGMLFTSCKNQDKETDTNQETTSIQSADEIPAKIATTTFTIDGMHCEVGCAGAIKKKIAKLDGVEEVDIDFQEKRATVRFDTNKQTPEVFVQTVESMSKDYIISDVESSDNQAYLFNGDKDKKKKKKKNDTKSTSAEENSSTKSCSGTEKKGGCCAAKKAETL